ncbi:C4-dicarboxylate ABC transporter [Terrihabitans soli]|uniref:C4-dicarboxylate ABC transporter n=1 Tax=Terrihabitans soli TaxID=708113 RepID=A0A6S6QM10_9HYPH|nr:tripartite tricarboxylate transporter TctB family protein [Terrihabitans soli]BCJ90386.1 C4-dicarboxylate ABC transporter [Terrihabitans soli]
MTKEPVQRRAQPDKAAFVVAVFLAALGALIAWNAAHLNANVAAYSRIGAAAFPYAIAGLLFAAALGTVAAAAKGEFPDREPLEFSRLAWILGGLVAQIVLLGFAGFSIATGVLFALAARGFGGKPLWLTIPIGIVLSFLLYLLFHKGLQLSLPQGPLERLV